METKSLGSTGLLLSVIGLGTLGMGKGSYKYTWGHQEDADSEETIRKAIELGVNWIDTDPLYGFGHSEEVIGRVLKTVDKKPMISTKCGFICSVPGKVRQSLDPKSIREGLESSLERLQLDVIDMLTLEVPSTRDEENADAWKTIAELKAEGKIRYAGLSNFGINEIRTLSAIAPVSFVQTPYNMFRRRPEIDIFPFCEKNNVGVISYDPLAIGLLSGNLPDKAIGSDAFRLAHKNNTGLLTRLNQIAKKKNISLATLGVLWCLRLNKVASVIAGARKPSQISELAASTGIQFTTAEREDIQNIIAKFRSGTIF